MVRYLILLALALAYTQAAPQGVPAPAPVHQEVQAPAEEDWVKPKFCNGLDCPKYTVVKTTKDYEQRKYESSPWVMTTMVVMEYEEVRRMMFYRLFNYIAGDNDQSKKVAMTAPVLTKAIAGSGPACESNFTMGFFIAAKEADNPPKPTNPDVFLAKLPEMIVYTRSFGGYASQEDYVKVAGELAAALPKGTNFDKSHFYMAGYDSPYKPFDRHNEVWFTAM